MDMKFPYPDKKEWVTLMNQADVGSYTNIEEIGDYLGRIRSCILTNPSSPSHASAIGMPIRKEEARLI